MAFKNILGSLTKGGKNYKKKNYKKFKTFWKSNIKFKGDWLMAEDKRNQGDISAPLTRKLFLNFVFLI